MYLFFGGGNTTILRCIIFIYLVVVFSFDQNKNHVSPYLMGSFHAQFKSNVKFMGGN